MKKAIEMIMPVLDIILIPFVYPSAWLLKQIRRVGVQRMPNCKAALINIGVFPIRDHYYEPQFNYDTNNHSFSRDRILAGINWNTAGQLEYLATFSYTKELNDIPKSKRNALEFHFNNEAFESGDAEYWYQLIRTIKPRRVIEVGSGYSTLMAIKAIRKSKEEDCDYTCRHVCIEPYENPWLEDTGVHLIREKVENLDLSFFSELKDNDILFVDSSHIIRPHGDVLFEILELMPSLNKGVIVHLHDIFSPKNYPRKWLVDEIKFWNEQYLLEAFLSHNSSWEVLGALNYLHHNYYDALKLVAPYLSPNSEPGSFYIRKIA